MLTLGDARKKLSRYVQNGVPCTSPRVPVELEMAQHRLINKAGAQSTIRAVELYADGCSRVTMPREAKYLIKARVCGNIRPAQLLSRFYRYLSNGPGDLTSFSTAGIEDLGEDHATFYEWPEQPLRVMAIAEDSGDNGVTLHVRGLDEYGRELIVDGIPGVDLILSWGQSPEDPPRYTKQFFSKITGLVKPETKGWVHVFAYQPQFKNYQRVASMHPRDTTTRYKRYQLPSPWAHRVVQGLVKLRVLPLEHDHDPLVIDNIASLKAMLQAMQAEDAGNIRRAREHEMVAVDLLREEFREYDSMLPELDVDPDLMGIGMNDGVI